MKLADFTLKLGSDEYVPIMIGGMGTNISTTEMAVEAARLGGIGHISDAVSLAVADSLYGTHFTKDKFQKYKDRIDSINKSFAQFDMEIVKEATKSLVEKTMEAKKGLGGVFINLMEKLTMNNPKETLKARLIAALDGGIDGISLGAGLHLNSLGLIEDHPRFRDAKIGIIVSSVRALKLFLTKTKRLNRLPDYVVVEGPLAGGHLGFGIDDWKKINLKTITTEVINFIKKSGLSIPVIPAGGIFTGRDAVDYMKMGASAVQVATRFTVTQESGLPSKARQEFFRASEEDIDVNLVSPTGYPMRMLKNSPCIGAGNRPNCEMYGYILDKNGDCSYVKAYQDALAKNPEKVSVIEKTCLCTHMKNYRTWTCGQYVYRLKDKAEKLPDGTYREPSTEEVFNDYLYNQD